MKVHVDALKKKYDMFKKIFQRNILIINTALKWHRTHFTDCLIQLGEMGLVVIYIKSDFFFIFHFEIIKAKLYSYNERKYINKQKIPSV